MKLILYYVFLSYAIILSYCQGSTVPTIEIDALQSLYDSTNGINWIYQTPGSEWDFSTTTVNPCDDQWVGIGCQCIGNVCYVSSLLLSSTNLTGFIPDEISDLSSLFTIDFSNNTITGTFPTAIVLLQNLTVIDFSANVLSGNIPNDIGNLTSLTNFTANANYISGVIPAQLLEISSLECVELEDNILSGTIPEGFYYEMRVFILKANILTGALPLSLANATKMQHFDVSINRFSSIFPFGLMSGSSMVYFAMGSNTFYGDLPSLQNWTQLEYFSVAINYFSGSLPSSVNHLPNLLLFDASENLLTGFLPLYLSGSTALSCFVLNHNHLYGSIPSEYGELTGLVLLDLSVNYLSGSIPSDFGKLNAISTLILSINILSGGIPESIGNMSSLQGLYLYANSLSKSLPSSLGDLSVLYELIMHQNYFVGNIPASFGNLSSLMIINMGRNSLEGSIPAELGKLTNMITLGLFRNYLVGTLPETFSNLRAIQILELFTNKISGSLPSLLGGFSMLNQFDISSNSIDGTLPSEVGQLSNLRTFNVAFNRLTGTVPSSFSRMSRLVNLVLHFNSLYGTLPTQLVSLRHLGYLNIFNNFFTGPFPEVVYNKTKLTYVFLDDNSLTGTIPYAIGSQTYLNNVYFDANYFTGSLPSSINNLIQILDLSFSDNYLSGELPEELSNMSTAAFFNGAKNYFSGTIPSSFGFIDNLAVLDFSHNFLVGEVPMTLSGLANLKSISLYNNRLSGSFPQVSSLRVVRLSQNKFNFPVYETFEMCSEIDTIDISYNQFSGEFPNQIFQSITLRNFIATSNCYHGSISDLVCSALGLYNLEISGLASSLYCRNSLPWNDNIYFSNYISGHLPDCLFGMDKLIGIFASGNGLAGTLPEITSPSLLFLTLSHNRLHGSIPESYQTSTKLVTLDLSFNRLDGTIEQMSTFVNVYGHNISLHPINLALFENLTLLLESDTKSLVLNGNRISGHFPGTFTNANITMNILDGNLFSCKFYPSTLPRNDPNRDRYVCGSDELDFAMYIYTGAFALGVALLCGIGHFLRKIDVRIYLLKLQESWYIVCKYLFWKKEDVSEHGGLHTIAVFMSKFRFYISRILAFIVLICMPMFAIMSNYYGTHTHLYGWKLSLGFLEGSPPVIFASIMWFVLMCVLIHISVLHIISTNEDKILAKKNKHMIWGGSSVSMGNPVFWKDTQREAVVIILNMVIVSLVNFSYVYQMLQGSTKLRLTVTILVIIFKLIWTPIMCTVLLKLKASSKVMLFCIIFNNVLAPIIATMAVDISCFQYLFEVPEPIVSKYVYLQCALFHFTGGSTDSRCYLFVPYKSTSQFQPPFMYSYQCSNSILQDYIPIFILLYLFTGVALPLLRFGFHIFFARVLDSDCPAYVRELYYKFKDPKPTMYYAFSLFMAGPLTLPLEFEIDFAAAAPDEEIIDNPINTIHINKDSASVTDNASVGIELRDTTVTVTGEIGNPSTMQEKGDDLDELAARQTEFRVRGSMYEFAPLLTETYSLRNTVTNPIEHKDTQLNEDPEEFNLQPTNASDKASFGSQSFLNKKIQIGDHTLHNISLNYRIRILCLNCVVAATLLLSFGLAYPPLAIILMIQIISTTGLVQLCVHQHYYQVKETGRNDYMMLWSRRLMVECQDMHKILFEYINPLTMLISLFICLFLVDMSGEFQYATLSVVFGISFVIGLLYIVRRNRITLQWFLNKCKGNE